MRQFLIVANWKMNPSTVREAVRLAKASDAKGVVICPPSIFLDSVGGVIKNAKLGAQNMHWEEKGAYTGEVSSRMLGKSGAQYVIIGHSERRHMGETDEIIKKKLVATEGSGLIPIFCVGEPIETRKKGIASVKQFIASQFLKGISEKSDYPAKKEFIVAYEPIWAISKGLGTGTPDDPGDSAVIMGFIKEELTGHYRLANNRVLYGGSVTSRNISRLIQYDAVEGVLVGGASVHASEFKKIIAAIKKS